MSKSGGLAHGRRLFERYGLHYMLLGVWQAKNVSAEKNRLADRRSGGATEGAAGQPKERQGGPQRGLRPKKGFRCFGAEVIIQ